VKQESTVRGIADGAGRDVQLEAVLAEHQGGLLRYATRILNNDTSAQDVVQNVFIKLCRHWGRDVHPSGKLKSWLYRVTHNEAVDYIRRESRRRDLHDKHEVERVSVASTACPDGRSCPMGADEQHELVLRFLGKLHPREQQIVLLRLEEGLSYREISDVTGRSEGNVGNILHHAVRKLSEHLKRAGMLAGA
jgi:RNA polymerase sigma factor (sigma-70 family)